MMNLEKQEAENLKNRRRMWIEPIYKGEGEIPVFIIFGFLFWLFFWFGLCVTFGLGIIYLVNLL